MTIYKSKYKRHKIIIKPATKVRVGDGFEFKAGVFVQFENGIYRTNDKEMIAVLDEISKTNPIEKISEKEYMASLKTKKPTTK